MSLNGNELRYLVEEINRMALNEISVKDAYNRFYSNVPQEDYEAIINSLQNGNDVLLPETKWVLGLYKKNPSDVMGKIGDLHNTENSGYLDLFNRLKTIGRIVGNEGDLNRFRTLSDFVVFVDNKMEEIGDDEIWGDNTFRKKKNLTDKMKGAAAEIKLHYESDTWIVLTPETWAASCYWANEQEYGKGVNKWCTAYKDSDRYFHEYNDDGDLYININKKTGERFQFHFQSESFMDNYDKSLIDKCEEMPLLACIPNGAELIKVYKNLVRPGDIEALISAYWYDGIELILHEDGLSYFYKDNKLYMNEGFEKAINIGDLPVVTKNGKKNIVNFEDKSLYFGDWFDDIKYVGAKYASIFLKEKGWNYVDLDSEEILFPNMWFDLVKEMSNIGIGAVAFGDYGWNYVRIGDDDVLCPDVWFNGAEAFCEYGFANVRKDSKYNVIDKHGKLLSDIWFDYVGSTGLLYSNRGLPVGIDGKGYNLLKTDGSLLSPHLWFDEIFDFGRHSDTVVVDLHDKGRNLINFKGELLSKIWYHRISPVEVGNYRFVVTHDGKHNYINVYTGELLSPDIWFTKSGNFRSYSVDGERYKLLADVTVKSMLNCKIDINGDFYDNFNRPLEKDFVKNYYETL